MFIQLKIQLTNFKDKIAYVQPGSDLEIFDGERSWSWRNVEILMIRLWEHLLTQNEWAPNGERYQAYNGVWGVAPTGFQGQSLRQGVWGTKSPRSWRFFANSVLIYAILKMQI